jgi:hypothetical protein
MSAREDAQRAVAGHLLDHYEFWSAPYGVIEGLVSTGRGKARCITFGVARLLDAEAWIFSPTKLVVRGSGGLAYRVEGTYGSAEDLVARLAEVDGSADPSALPASPDAPPAV